MKTISKAALISEVAKKDGIEHDAAELVIGDFIEAIKQHVEHGEKVVLNGFMSIFLRTKSSYRATNFNRWNDNKGVERMVVSGGRVPWVKVSRSWKKAVAQPNQPQTEDSDKAQLSLFDE